MDGEAVNVVVIGSGFGGSVTAYKLANEGKSVCLLERGHSWPPGSFARRPDEMARNFWDPSEGLHGLFDIWSFRRLEAVVSSGLGGGSLIYANVLLRKPDKWFIKDAEPGGGYESWPVTRQELDPHYDAVLNMIGASPYPYRSQTPKTDLVFDTAARLGRQAYLPDLAITFARGHDRPGTPIPDSNLHNLHRVWRSTCKLCGECDIGCNEGSKNTMDLTYLSAAAKKGADLRVDCEVRSFRPCPGGYQVSYVRHHRDNEGAPMDTSRLPLHTIRCRVLVLAAGALGSTFLLLRNRAAFPGLSPALGTRFSCNGDALGWIHHSPHRLEPSLGPVITATWEEPDTQDGGTGPGYFVQDGGHPGFVDWVYQTSILPAGGLLRFAARRLAQDLSGHPRSEIGGYVGGLLAGGRRSAGILPLLAFGRDVPDGTLSLRRGYLEAELNERSSRELFVRIEKAFAALADRAEGRLLTQLKSWPHRRVTVHPVGGIPMGEDSARGVVDSYGEVFGHRSFFVVDGSVMPGPVGPNPSFTIAAMADRFCERIIERAK